MMWIRVYASKNEDLADNILACLKDVFKSAPLSISKAEGQSIKINLEGDGDEKPLSNLAYSIEKFYFQAWKRYKKHEDPIQTTED